ncbi:hypothetical protein LX64_02999 [Chitinophaga skermanii]|uniref:Lipoprotein n=1 Tax=Chitinophaga skermanii TaxID=331697 RepID=A0A327QIH5_9BACT|nr:hypothetical protein [Chitinophaga skermanii]RAJ04121.1 hypothetical protein LX64_02999 [Chitinophaga skermanii]
MKYIALCLSMLLLFTACKKENNGTTVVTRTFVSFKLDGVIYICDSTKSVSLNQNNDQTLSIIASSQYGDIVTLNLQSPTTQFLPGTYLNTNSNEFKIITVPYYRTFGANANAGNFHYTIIKSKNTEIEATFSGTVEDFQTGSPAVVKDGFFRVYFETVAGNLNEL